MIFLAESVSRIRDNLWVGQLPSDVYEYKSVFALVGNIKYYVPDDTLLVCYPFDDGDEIPNEAMLYRIANMVLTSSKEGNTLVHCKAGLNRSALIAALALIIDGVEPQAAIDLIKEKRGQEALFNKTFVQWLLQQSK